MTVNEYEAQDPALEITESRVTDADRNKAINAIRELVKGQGAFAPKERSEISEVKKRLASMMEGLGYDTKHPACIAAMAAFIENVERAFFKK